VGTSKHKEILKNNMVLHCKPLPPLLFPLTATWPTPDIYEKKFFKIGE
jgi:hypothetical protein